MRISASRPNCSGPAISTVPLMGSPTAVRATALATASAAMGWMRAGGSRTVPPSVAASAMLLTNSKNWVACTIEQGMPDALTSRSCASLARKYPLSVSRSVPTTDRATWWPTPAGFSAARRLPVAVVKNSSAALASNEGELDTSTTTCAPDSTSASPSPVRVVTPDLGDAAIASWPCSASRATTLEPMSPVPPITTSFIEQRCRVAGRTHAGTPEQPEPGQPRRSSNLAMVRPPRARSADAHPSYCRR